MSTSTPSFSSSAALKELFTRLNQTVIYVTHDQTEAMTLADRIALMQDGRITQNAPPREIYNQPDDVFGGWFMGNPGMNFFEGLFAGADAKGTHRIPFVNRPLQLVGVDGSAPQITLGIRPEHVRVHAERTSRQRPGPNCGSRHRHRRADPFAAGYRWLHLQSEAARRAGPLV